MQRSLRALRALSQQDRVSLVRAWFVLLVVDLGLRMSSLARVQRAVASALRRETPLASEDALEYIERVQRLVGIAARHHLSAMPCLRRALTVQWLLARQGIATNLRFGVRREAGRLLAHAWVDYAGEPLGEPEALEDRFAPLLAQGSEKNTS